MREKCAKDSVEMRKNMNINLKYNNSYMNKTFFLFVTVLMFLSMVGCSKEEPEKDKGVTKDGEISIYYMDKNETKLISEKYILKSTTKEDKVEELLEKLNSEPKDITYKKAQPENAVVEKYQFNEDKTFSIYFTTDYNNINSITEVLYRAAVVKTLCQLEEIESIDFYVGGLPLTGNNDKLVGRMESEDFVMSTGLENVKITIYFANKKGNALVGSVESNTYDGNMSIEKLILVRLIEGPEEDQASKGMIKTLPAGTELIKVSTKDGICYVDFNDKFLDKVPGVKDEVVIYSIVNSLVELSTINKVQFSINGSTKKTYRDSMPFDIQFERKLEIVEGSK
jgi:germination protein M